MSLGIKLSIAADDSDPRHIHRNAKCIEMVRNSLAAASVLLVRH